MATISELGQLPFLDPSMYLQGLAQVDQGNQKFAQDQAMGAANLEQQTLANQFAQQGNPLRLQQLGLQNTGMGYENTVKQLNAEDAASPEARAAKRAAHLKTVDEDTLSRLKAQGEALSMDPDPVKAARGRNMFDGTWAEIKRREAANADQTKTETLVGGRKDVAATNAGARSASDQLKANTQLAIQGMKSADNQAKLSRVLANGIAPDKLLGGALQDAARETDPDKRAELLEYAQGIQNVIIAQKQALSGQQIDTANLANLPKNPLAPVNVGSAPIARPPAPAQGGVNLTPGAQLQPGTRPVVPASYQQQLNATRAETLQAEWDKPMLPQARADLALEAKNAKIPLKGPGGGEGRMQEVVPVKATKEGYTVIYKNGQPSQVPTANLEKALAQGYTLK